MKKKLSGLIGAAVLAVTSAAPAFAFAYDETELYHKGKSADGTYDYTVWRDIDQGTVSFDGDKTNGGIFSCKWNDISSASFSKGHLLEPEKVSYKDFDSMTCDYTITSSSDGDSYYGVHGWVENREKGYQQNKYVEFLIIDGYTGNRLCNDKESLGTAEIDGSTYDIYRLKHAAFDAPIVYQYFSVISEEDNKADSSTAVSSQISIDKHFEAWENNGIDMSGLLYEVSFDVEGWMSSGEAEVTQNDIVFGSRPVVQTVLGDLNGDGGFSVADIVSLQGFLLGRADVKVWNNADYNGNGRLDVFDFILMKRRLFSRNNTEYVEPDERIEYGVPLTVISENLKLYKGPGENYDCIDSIPAGTRISEKGFQKNNNEWLFTEYNGMYGWIRTHNDDGKMTVSYEMAAKKPVIYLYPEQETDVHVELELSGADLSTTYPKYNNGWDITAYPDGTLLNKADGTHHRYLFWDAVNCRTRFDFSKGFCVAGSDTESFLREKLAYMGLNENEMNEFIVYWLPLMEHNAYNLISFQGDAYTDSAKLDISPSPESLLRIFMAYVPLEESVDIEPQQLVPFERTGFTVVEWGGSEVKA